jgi:hypothetical protein
MTSLQHPGAERLLYRNVSTSGVVLAGDNYSVTPLTLITCLGGTFAIFVQKITIGIITEHNSTARFRDTAGTPLVLAEIENPSTEAPYTWDFGEDGFQLTAGEDLVYANSGAGMALSYAVQAYMKAVSTMVAKAAGMAAGDFTPTL